MEVKNRKRFSNIKKNAFCDKYKNEIIYTVYRLGDADVIGLKRVPSLLSILGQIFFCMKTHIICRVALRLGLINEIFT